MNFKRLLNTPIGIAFISILLGLGLATLFRKVCKDRDCIVFKGPVITDVVGKTFKHDNKCYNYKIHPSTCDNNKKTVNLTNVEELEEKN
jgi:hypothetical protein